MSNCVVAKLFVGLGFCLLSLWGAKHAGVKSIWSKFVGTGQEGAVPDSYEPTKCHTCLEEGKDFCISGNNCIPRAMLQCRGPHDHITGDKEFALHGNPKGIKHSMVCPEAARSKDCYFDKECHAKVNWEKVTNIKGGFFARLKLYKEKSDAPAVKEMMGKVHKMFLEAGMPEDRIDYILEKWVKSVYPEALKQNASEEKPRFSMCTIAEERCMKDGQKILKGRCIVQWKACESQWMEAKAANPEKQDAGVDVKDCYFDEECHAKVNWEKIENIKGRFFGGLKLYKMKGDKGAVKDMMSKVHKMFQEAGMPDDRIDYILTKWVKNVYPEALQEDTVVSISV